MLTPRSVDLATFQQLGLKTGTVAEVTPIDGADGLVRILVEVDCERQVALVTSDVLPSSSIVGARVVVVSNLHPLTVGTSLYSRTLLTAGQPARLAVLADEVPASAALF